MPDPLDLFRRNDAGEAELRQATAALGEVSEPPSFWTAIAGDGSYGAQHRACAVVQLFRRHLPPGTPLGELGRVLGEPGWLREMEVSVVTALGGKIPVRWTADDTVFVLCIAPGGDERARACAYLRVGGRVERGEMVRLLHGEPVSGATRQAVIGQVGVSGPCAGDA